MGSSTVAPQPSPPTSTPASASYYCTGICTSYCLQFCTAENAGYFLGPPSPLFTVGGSSSDSSFSSGGRVSPLMIALISVLAAAFIVLSYYTFAYKYCKRRRSRNDAVEDELQLQARLDHLVFQDSSSSSVQFAIPAVHPNGGLDEQFIRSITVFKYRRGDGLVESTDCAVCLTEFKEDERLRLMPNCQHAFHPPCIDTWLRSHSNCPICRASMVGAPPQPPPVISRMRAQSRGDVVVIVDGGGSLNRVREIGADRRDMVSQAPVDGDVDLTAVSDEKGLREE